MEFKGSPSQENIGGQKYKGLITRIENLKKAVDSLKPLSGKVEKIESDLSKLSSAPELNQSRIATTTTYEELQAIHDYLLKVESSLSLQVSENKSSIQELKNNSMDLFSNIQQVNLKLSSIEKDSENLNSNLTILFSLKKKN